MAHIHVFLLGTFFAVAWSECPQSAVLDALKNCHDALYARTRQYEPPDIDDPDYHKYQCCTKVELESCVRGKVTDEVCRNSVEEAVDRIWTGKRGKIDNVECKHNCSVPVPTCPLEDLKTARRKCMRDAGLTKLPDSPSTPVDPAQHKEFCCTVKKLHACEKERVQNIACQKLMEASFKKFLEETKKKLANRECDYDCPSTPAHCSGDEIEKAAAVCLAAAKTEYKDFPQTVDPSHPDHHELACCAIMKTENCVKAKFKEEACNDAIERQIQPIKNTIKLMFSNQECTYDCGFNAAAKLGIARSVAAVVTVVSFLAVRGNL